jgi:hypothetical protein
MAEIDHKARIAQLVSKYGCVPTDAPDGPVLENWNLERLAAGIEQEAARARVYGWTKITLHMDLPDALRLAQALRRRR